MRRFSITIVMLALAVGTATAQDSTFRYESDPFSTEEGQPAANTVAADVDSPDVDKQGSSYESYESSPTSVPSLVQKKAMYRAEQRQLRIASRRWFGFSPSRPAVVGNPYMTSYRPILNTRSWSPSYSWYGNPWY